jgi:glyoxylate/hydroxypyruvate reductase
MHIVFHAPDTRPEPWLDGLRTRLPQASVADWTPGGRAADFAVVWAPPQALVDDQPGLRAVFNLGAGVDALLALAWRDDTLLVRLDDAGMAVQMAEVACEAVIRHFRELDRYEAQAREGRWQRHRPRRRSEWPVGVLGLGVLGRRVATALAGFDFPVRGYSPSARSLPGVETFHGPAGLDPFLRASRHLVCLVPMTLATTDLLNRRTLGLLQPGGLVINLARGAVLVEDDLLDLLDAGHVDGAVLDVFRTEPLPAGHRFWHHPRVRVTPHVAAHTLRDDTLDQIAGKILAVDRGEPIAGVVDRQRGY